MRSIAAATHREVQDLLTASITDWVWGCVTCDDQWPSWTETETWMLDPTTWGREILGGLSPAVSDADRRELRIPAVAQWQADEWLDQVLDRHRSWRAWTAYVTRADISVAADMLRRYGRPGRTDRRQGDASPGAVTAWDELAHIGVSPWGWDLTSVSPQWGDDVCCPALDTERDREARYRLAWDYRGRARGQDGDPWDLEVRVERLDPGEAGDGGDWREVTGGWPSWTQTRGVVPAAMAEYPRAYRCAEDRALVAAGILRRDLTDEEQVCW